MEIPSILIRNAADTETGAELTQYSYSAERDKSIERPASADDAMDHKPVRSSDLLSETILTDSDDLLTYSEQSKFEIIERQRNPGIDEIKATWRQQVMESRAVISREDLEDSPESEWHESRFRRQAQPNGILTRESVEKQITGFFEKARPSRKRPRM